MNSQQQGFKNLGIGQTLSYIRLYHNLTAESTFLHDHDVRNRKGRSRDTEDIAQHSRNQAITFSMRHMGRMGPIVPNQEYLAQDWQDFVLLCRGRPPAEGDSAARHVALPALSANN